MIVHLTTQPSLRWLLDAVASGPPRLGTTRLLCVDGRSGSGKSTLARELAAAGPGAEVVELERLYAGWDGLVGTPERAAAEILTPLATGKTARYRTWDWHRADWNGLSEQTPVPLLILEGVGAAAPALAAHATLTVWLEQPARLRKERALARDGATFAEHWDAWALEEERLLRSYPTPRADVVIDLSAQ